mgnify:CR=1 FL=1
MSIAAEIVAVRRSGVTPSGSAKLCPERTAITLTERERVLERLVPPDRPDGGVLVPIRADDVMGYLVVDPRRREVRPVPAHLRPGALVVPQSVTMDAKADTKQQQPERVAEAAKS